MGHFLKPLICFCSGMALLLVSFLFFPAIGDNVVATNAAIGSATINHYWGLSWVLGSQGGVIKLLLLVISLGLILYSVAVVWLKRDGGRLYK